MLSGRETLLRYIRRLASPPEMDQVSDAALLDRFIVERDQRAFTTLVGRHGAMVLQVCQRILGNADDAEDAFQATFLVLARKAVAIGHRDALAAWLYGVARRVALKTRAARVRYHETGPLQESPAEQADPLAELSARELLTIVDEEVQRLPERYRLPLILCCLGGRTLEEAARQLGWTSGSVKGRLERGRARLHDRLVRRGLTLSAALAAVEASRATTSAAVLAGLVVRTVPGALAFGTGQAMGTGISTSAVALAGRIVKAMALPRLTMVAALLLTTVALGAGIAFHRPSPSQIQDSSPRADLATLPKPVQHLPEPFWDQSAVPIDVKGQVLDPHGRPLAGAELYVGYSVRRFVGYSARHFASPTPEDLVARPARPQPHPRRAMTDADGRFHFRFATSELDPRVLDEARPAVMAVAPGYGPQWTEVRPSADGDLKLQLVDDLPVRGRVLDVKRRPIIGAKLVVQALCSAPEDALTRFLKGDMRAWAPRCWEGPLPGNTPTIVTDADGRWRCGGLGRDRIVVFAIEGPQVPRTFVNVATRPGKESYPVYDVRGPAFDYLVRPVRTIRGVVRDRASHKAIAGIRVSIQAGKATVRTGPDGQFEILGYSETENHVHYLGYNLVAQPEADQGYFVAQVCVHEQAGAAILKQDLSLVRGVVLSGKVTNRSPAKPPKTARVEYYPLSSNPHARRITCRNMVPASSAVVHPDGSYSLVVLPGPGFIGVVASPREDYAQGDITNKEWAEFLGRQQALLSPANRSDIDPYVSIALEAGQSGDLPINKYHALALVNPPEGAQSWVLNLSLQTAQTLQGTVLGPDGQPLGGVEVVGLTALRDTEWLEGASFTITGLNPQGSRQLFFRHPGKKLGKVITVRANAPQPVTVKLEPCGTVRGRLVDKRGVPVRGVYVTLNDDASPGYTMAKTDDGGRFQIAVFPEQKYFWGLSPRLLSKAVLMVQVRAGQVHDLGDLKVAR